MPCDSCRWSLDRTLLSTKSTGSERQNCTCPALDYVIEVSTHILNINYMSMGSYLEATSPILVSGKMIYSSGQQLRTNSANPLSLSWIVDQYKYVDWTCMFELKGVMTWSIVDVLSELCSPFLKGGNSAFITVIASGLFPQTEYRSLE